MPARLNQHDFLLEACARHGQKYDYSKAAYTTAESKVTIICPEHGPFAQLAATHLRGCGCPRCGVRARVQMCGGHNRLDTAQFVKRATIVHDGFYDYSKVIYENSHRHVLINCPVHGQFSQPPARHLIGSGCMRCGQRNVAKQLRMSSPEFDERLRHVHGGRILRVGKYTNSKTKLLFRCAACGIERCAYPMNVLKGIGIGCRCTNFRRQIGDFICDARRIHGDKYDYCFVEFRGIHEPVKILCHECGNVFYQTPASHLHSACGCNKCGRKRSADARTMSAPQFLRKAREVHGSRYQYDLNSYVNCRTKMRIVCPEHGPFEQVPFNHMKGHRCNKCGSAITGHKQTLSLDGVKTRLAAVHGNRLQIRGAYKKLSLPVQVLCTACGIQRKARPADLLKGDGIACRCSRTYRRNTEMFIAEAIETHGTGRYDYTETRFATVKTPVKIRCNQCGESFEQSPESHLQGCGCPVCAQPRGERDIAAWLKEHGFSFVAQKKFPLCKYYRLLPFDFFLEEHRLLIEYDGAQHHRAVTWFGGENALKLTQLRDARKNAWASSNGYRLIRIRYDEDISEVLESVLLG